MPSPIEDYAVIGNRETMAMVARDGSIDWLGFPRFDSDPCFAALLGEPEHGRWQIRPKGETAVRRRYRGPTLILETEFATAEGAVLVTDCMSRVDGVPVIVRIVRGLAGEVAMAMELIARFEYGAMIPWATRLDDGRLSLVAGAERLILATSAEIRGEDLKTIAEFSVKAGEEVPFVLTWLPSFMPVPPSPDAGTTIEAEARYWSAWSQKYPSDGPYGQAVLRSLITLKALAHHETGGIVAAATTSLPEEPGGPRNWDYRFCWLRDSTFTLYALIGAGFIEEAEAWRDWLLRAVAGSAMQIQTMYGVAGERRLTEQVIEWLPGYMNSRPVRIGNAASVQLQLDIYGEVLDSLDLCRRKGVARSTHDWDLEKQLVDCLARIWHEPDEGIWEVRGGAQHFTHSKVMAWVALDRAVRGIEEFGFDGPLDQWRTLRAAIHEDVCRNGFNAKIGSFVQHYGSTELDASLLFIPLVGFLPRDDPRVTGTIAAIERNLVYNGFVARYRTQSQIDGLGGGPEGAFLACSFWLADNYVLQGRYEEARNLFEGLLGLCNDVGLLAEQYDPIGKRMLGNFPQAFSHVALINTAHNLTSEQPPAEHRSGEAKEPGK
ncbi:MAG: glycoside hydrolase family 15 protein [Methylobacteriaceae bacterium]|nr:glycoside hydrolase family 15 protein [Methylobacteriaceae bacterium]